MTKYYYTPFLHHKDSALKSTKKIYSNHLIPVKKLHDVQPGDYIYLDAHGNESDQKSGIIEASYKNGTEQLTAKLAAKWMIADGLKDGTDPLPIRIKCLICYAGGKGVTLKQVKEGFLENGGFIRAAWAKGHFAQQLAMALHELGKQYIYVGGYPGAIRLGRRGVFNEHHRVSTFLRGEGDVLTEWGAVRLSKKKGDSSHSSKVAWYNGKGENIMKDGNLIIMDKK